MFKKLAILSFAALAAAILAQGLHVQGARGRGLARNAEGGGHFSMDVKKVSNGTETRVIGGFEFKAVATAPANAWRVVMRDARSYESEGKVAEFSGPAKLFRPGPSGPIVIEGKLVVRAADNHEPETDGEEPDRLRFAFITPTAPAPIVTFEGNVTHGDIKVYRRAHYSR